MRASRFKKNRPGPAQFGEPDSVGMESANQFAAKYGSGQSQISVAPPLTGSQTRAMSQMPQAFRGGGSSGNASRDAYARAMADAGSSQLAGTMDKYRQDFQRQAEMARSQDLTAQRQLGNAGYQTERERQQTFRQQDTQRQQTLDQIKQFKRIAQADAAAQRRNSMIQGIIGTGLVAATAPILGPALAGGAGLGGGAALGGGMGSFASSGAYGGLFGSLLGSGMVGSTMQRRGML
ncbi:MAG: hypothetical protein ACK52I_26310 [Pseudomonadota bacterium]